MKETNQDCGGMVKIPRLLTRPGVQTPSIEKILLASISPLNGS